MLDSVLDATQVLDGLNNPTASARALPGEWYTSEAHAREESRLLFARTWVCVGFAHELDQPGDIRPADVGDYPVVLMRTESGDIRAYHNICPHRGFKLVGAPLNGRRTVRCPYHHWAFDLEGHLKSTPHWGGYRTHAVPDFQPACHGLSPVASAQWHDWVFVNIDGNAGPLEDYIAPFASHFTEYDLDLLQHHECVPFEINGNWKIVEENFLEVLHLPPVHVRLSEYAPFQDHEVIADDVCVGTVIETGLPAAWPGEALPRFPRVDPTSQTAKNLALFPNLKLVIGPDHCCSMVEYPDGAGKTKQRWDFYFIGEGARDERFGEARRGIIDFFVETNREDMFAVEGLHVGRRSPAYQGGVLSEVWEGGVHHFQKLVARYMSPNP